MQGIIWKDNLVCKFDYPEADGSEFSKISLKKSLFFQALD